MGKCIVCGCTTNDLRGDVRTTKDGSKHNDYQCEECTIILVNEEHKEYKANFTKKVLPYLLKNKFKVVTKRTLDNVEDSKCVAEEFPVKDFDIMHCVDIIRKRMEEKGYCENWIDVHMEEYNTVCFEVVDYLCFALPNKSSNFWVSYSLNLVGDNNICLDRVAE